jgi:hypothetical protein
VVLIKRRYGIATTVLGRRWGWPLFKWILGEVNRAPGPAREGLREGLQGGGVETGGPCAPRFQGDASGWLWCQRRESSRFGRNRNDARVDSVEDQNPARVLKQACDGSRKSRHRAGVLSPSPLVLPMRDQGMSIPASAFVSAETSCVRVRVRHLQRTTARVSSGLVGGM